MTTSLTDLQDELDYVDKNEEIVDDRVYVVRRQVIGVLDSVRPRPQNDRIENNDKHDKSPEPLGPDNSVPDNSMYSRSAVFRRLTTMTALTVIFGPLTFHYFSICFIVLQYLVFCSVKTKNYITKLLDVIITSLSATHLT